MREQLEKRLSPRRTAAIRARISYGANQMDCIIRNISDSGAKLEVKSVGSVPNSVTLLVPGHEPHPCRVVWRSLKELGVAFQIAGKSTIFKAV